MATNFGAKRDDIRVSACSVHFRMCIDTFHSRGGEVIADALVSGTPWTGVGVDAGLGVGTAVEGAVGDA